MELATVGSLLIVGTDGPEFTRSADVGLALVTTVPLERAYGLPVPLDGIAPAGRHLVVLREGTLAEVWDGSVGLRPATTPGP